MSDRRTDRLAEVVTAQFHALRNRYAKAPMRRSETHSDAYRAYQRLAPFYDLIDGGYELMWKRGLRERIFAGAKGDLLDAGTGTGCNIAFYPDGTRPIAIDLSPGMLDRARRRAVALDRPVTFFEMDVMATRFADRSFDTIVSTFTFVVLGRERQLAALRELRRLIRPGGEVRILDYTMPDRGLGRLWFRLMAPMLRSVFAADYDPRTEDYVAEAGFELTEFRKLMDGTVKIMVLKPV